MLALYQLFLYKLKENLNYCTSIVDSIVSELRRLKINATNCMLRIDSFEKFSIIITVLENDFHSERFMDIYDFFL